MSRNMLKNSFPLRILRASLIIFETAPPFPEKAARSRKDSCIRKSHLLGGNEIQLLSHLTLPVHLTSLRHDAWCFLKQSKTDVCCCVLYLYLMM